MVVAADIPFTPPLYPPPPHTHTAELLTALFCRGREGDCLRGFASCLVVLRDSSHR